jgi:hypothetical protein
MTYMQQAYAGFRVAWNRGVAAWTGTIRPTPISQVYRVRIVYKLGDAPNVRVLSPKLGHRPDGSRAPHLYADDEPCLYLPGSGEWDSTQPIAATIVPWLSLWLFHYEVWLATGDWLGGGVHASTKEDGKKAGREA